VCMWHYKQSANDNNGNCFDDNLIHVPGRALMLTLSLTVAYLNIPGRAPMLTTPLPAALGCRYAIPCDAVAPVHQGCCEPAMSHLLQLCIRQCCCLLHLVHKLVALSDGCCCIICCDGHNAANTLGNALLTQQRKGLGLRTIEHRTDSHTQRQQNSFSSLHAGDDVLSFRRIIEL